MRGLILCLLLSGCCHAPRPVLSAAEIEVVLDEGRVDQQPLMPQKEFEVLMRFDTRLLAYRPLRLKLQMSHPGRVVTTIYAVDANGRPGTVLRTISRRYPPEVTTAAGDVKWLLEDLSMLPRQQGPLFVGFHCPDKFDDPRFWATSNDTGHVFQRSVEPDLTLDQMRIPRTPRVRLVVAPE